LLLPNEVNVIKRYLDKVGVRNADTVEDALQDVAQMLERVAGKNETNKLASFFEDRVSLEDAKAVVLKNLQAKQKKFAILMDSLDDFRLDIDSVGYALQGLLKIVGSMNKPRDIVDIRFCLPSELYPRFVELSSNPNKDFRRALKLQWSASELLLIGAQRLMFYLALNDRELYNKFIRLDLTKRVDALNLFGVVLPEKITNQTGVQEETISYILRHTQLLPRHLIILLNSIFKGNRSNQFPLRAERIINGIQQVEEAMVGEIFVAFNLIYPNAKITCRQCLPELGHKFTVADLHRVFTRHGKAVFGSDDLLSFQRMLLEIGAVGKVIPGSETDLYIKGRFEYTISHQLSISQDDELCVHPLFSGIFQGGEKQERPVYPYGSNFDDEEYRDGE
jgi:hypothetical protein